MEPHAKSLQAKAIAVRRLAESATIENIRSELLSIAAQYDHMADQIRALTEPEENA